MSKSTFEEQLEKNGRLIYTNVGDSMKPLIRQDRDLVIIEKSCCRLEKYDVPLYRRNTGQYVLHRILKVRKDDYVICGDNRWKKEYGISDNNVIGVLTGVVRNGKTVLTTDFRYRLYVHLWCDFFPVRAFIVRVILKVRKISRKRARHYER